MLLEMYLDFREQSLSHVHFNTIPNCEKCAVLAEIVRVRNVLNSGDELLEKLKEAEKKKQEARRGPNVKTGIDEMVKIIENGGKVPLEKIAEKLQVNEDLVQEWGKVLEKIKLVEVQYAAFRKPTYRIVKNTNNGTEEQSGITSKL